MIAWTLAALLAAAPPPAVGTAPAPLPAPEQIMAVPPDLQALLEARVLRRAHSRQKRLELLVDFVFDPDGLGLQYDLAATRTVEETFRSRAGNCLSFTLLFVALARQAGLYANVQEVGQVLVWYQEGDLTYDAGHVNARLRLGAEERTIDFDTNVLLARAGPKRISDRRALAHFYNNLGSDRLAAGDHVAATAALERALDLAPDFAPAWNNLGVLHARDGRADEAERAYLASLKLDRSNAPSLSNLVNLYERAGDSRQAQHYLHRLERARRADPFHQFMLAVHAEQRGDYHEAVSRYRRAIRLDGEAHPFHFGLARAYFLLGDTRRAQHALLLARALGKDDSTRNRYQAKLDSLRRLSGAVGHTKRRKPAAIN